jgi:3-hydroxybutyryl-CoA dehydratase
MAQLSSFESIEVGIVIPGPKFTASKETIREFCDASLDYNPLHLDETFMQGNFGKTQFQGVIVHGMTTFSLITRALVDWLEPRGGIHRRLETRWKAPVKPGDTIQPTVVLTSKQATKMSNWLTFEVEVKNQRGEVVATAEALAEVPACFASRMPCLARTSAKEQTSPFWGAIPPNTWRFTSRRGGSVPASCR